MEAVATTHFRCLRDGEVGEPAKTHNPIALQSIKAFILSVILIPFFFSCDEFYRETSDTLFDITTTGDLILGSKCNLGGTGGDFATTAAEHSCFPSLPLKK